MTKNLKIDQNYTIGKNSRTFVIAEIGQNHQGDMDTAKKLIQAAKDCGADCAKFQKTELTEKFNTNALNRSYSSPNSWGATYGEHKKYLEFTREQFIELQSFAKEAGILFAASPMDPVSVDLLVEMKVPFIKIGSGDANNFVLLEKTAPLQVPLIISTGMQNFETVQKIYETVKKYHRNFALLHCVSAYPTPVEDINLNVIRLFQEQFPDINVGYSGHELETHITLAAVALGAKIIERHITLDKHQKGSDHKCSLEPAEFTLLIQNIRSLEIAMGQPAKTIQASELACFEKLGKTIVVAGGMLKRGHKLSATDLKVKVAEPKGINATFFETLLGRTLAVDKTEDESLFEHDILWE